MSHNSIIVIKEFLTPNIFKQFLRRNNFSSVLTQVPEDRKLNRCQSNLFSIQSTFVSILVYNKSSYIMFCNGSIFSLGISRIIITNITTKLCFYSCDNLQRVEWFCNVIISSDGKSHNFISILNFCRQNYNRIKILFSDFLTNTKSINIWKHYI